MSAATDLGLAVEKTIVVRDSTKLSLRLLPCDVLARVALAREGFNPLELRIASQLAATGGPVGALDPRVEPTMYRRGGFLVTFWTYCIGGSLWRYYDPRVVAGPRPSSMYARALKHLHADLRQLDFSAPHFMEWVSGAEQFLAGKESTVMLDDADRELIRRTLASLVRSLRKRGAAEQLLHGEPFPDNVLDGEDGPLFIDWDTACRGPVEYDLAYVPVDVAALYPDHDEQLVEECRGFALVRIALCRCEPDDQLPDREANLRWNLRALRQGPPWPTIDAMDRSDAPPSQA